MQWRGEGRQRYLEAEAPGLGCDAAFDLFGAQALEVLHARVGIGGGMFEQAIGNLQDVAADGDDHAVVADTGAQPPVH